MRRVIVFVLALGLVQAFLVPAQAGFVQDRNTLNQFLVNPVTETFETLPVNINRAFPMFNTTTSQIITTLDKNTQFDWNGSGAVLPQGHYGPNLVLPGVTFSAVATGSETQGPLQWNGKGWYSQSSRTLQAEQNQLIRISFNPSAGGFGVDLTAWGNNTGFGSAPGPFPQQARVTVFNDSGIQIASRIFTLNVDSSGNPIVVFAGYVGDFGTKLGHVDITTIDNNGLGITWSPIIDNVEFAPQAIPEPASLTLLGTAFAGLLFWRWRKRK